MKALLRFIPSTVAIIVWIAFWVALQRPLELSWGVKIATSAVVSGIVLLLGIYFITLQNILKSKFWMHCITPLLLLASGWGTMLFLENVALRYVVVITVITLVWIYLKTIYIYYNQRQKYQAHALENISNYANVVAIFLYSITLYNFFLFALFPFWQSLVVGVLVSMIVVLGVTAQMLWVSTIRIRETWMYIAIVVATIAEVIFVTRFLPVSIFVSASITTIAYYAIVGIVRNYLLDIFETKVLRRYTLVSGILLLIILFTAKWQ